MYDLMNKLKEKPLSDKIALQKNATPILTPQDLLSSEKRQQNLTDIRTLLSLPDDEYDKIFLSVVHNFANFVQNLPETERSFYASLGGMIDHALERAALSLFLARTYLLPEGSTLSSVSEDEMLWVYAIFTASLLLDVGKISTHHVVSLTDEAGNIVHAWDPYAGPMQIKDKTTHYVFGFNDHPNDHLRWQVTPLLARQIMPADGFNWLASNEEVLQAWLGLLSDDQREMGWLKVIPLADAQIIESYFTDRKVFRSGLPPQTIALINKILKEKKDAQKRQKELGEKMLNEHAEKAIVSKDSKDAKDSKLSKDALFGAAMISQSDKLKSLAKEMKTDPKSVVDRFIKWLETQDKQHKTTVQNTTDGALITEAVINKFISDNKNLGVTAQQVHDTLKSQGVTQAISNPVAFAQQTGQMGLESMKINPYIAFPNGGPPPIAMGMPGATPQGQVAPLTPAQQLAQQQSQQDMQQKAQEHLQPHTPTPYNIKR